MTVKDIIEIYLKENGFDGLCEPSLDCWCFIDDLAPCGSDMANCQPGYRMKMKGGEDEFDGVGLEH